MFRGFLTAFIIIVLAIAFILYGYGKKTMTNMSSEKTDAFVDSTTVSPNAAAATLMKNWVDYAPQKSSARNSPHCLSMPQIVPQTQKQKN